MAMGRANGDKRVEKAIKNALDSPLLYGNDITKAQRILFNIYSSDDTPIMVPEMQEIDDFFAMLDPNIEVIWGISTDNSLGDDAKVTILATGMETDSRLEADYGKRDTDYYDSLISKLYKPIVKPIEEPAEEPVFEVTVPKEPEPAVITGERKQDKESATPHQSARQCHSREVLTHKKRIPQHNGRIHCKLLHREQSHAPPCDWNITDVV